tara:strand:+ start:678 stop:842 length:165 start_codon:yes stop_codon:yes gene_type:complete
LKVDLDNQELSIVIQAMEHVNIKGSDAISFAKILTKLQRAFTKEHDKAIKAEAK